MATALKKNYDNIDRLTKELDKINQPSSFKKEPDERFWQPEVDKAGNGYAVIRFLPAPEVDGEDALPWVRYFDHGFQGPTNKWYIENSLTSLNQKDPVGEYNSQLWNNGTKAGQEQARKQKRRLHYVSNVLVIEDPKNPQNNGKFFLFKYGKKIFDKLTEAMNPQFEDEKPLNPFHPFEGANFKIKIRKVEGYRNYDKSEFESPSKLFGGDSGKIDDLNSKEYSLKAFLDPSLFKPYDVLKKKLDDVMGGFAGGVAAVASSDQYPKTEHTTVVAKPRTAETAEPTLPDDDGDDELLKFEKLAEDDD